MAWKSTEDILETKYIDYPAEIKNKIIEKLRIRRVWQHSTNPQDKIKLNSSNREVKEMMHDLKLVRFLLNE